MKRFLILMLSLLLIVSCVVGCAAYPSVDVKNESKQNEIVQFVSSHYSSVFAVLYADGTVGVGGLIYTDNEDALEAYYPALKWKNIKKLALNIGTLIGICEDGTVECVSSQWNDDYPPLYTEHLTNVVDVAYMEPGDSFFFLLEDGTVECVSQTYEDQPEFVPFEGVYEEWTGVKNLVAYYYYDIFGIFEDGSVQAMGEYDIADDQLPFWTDIRDLYVDQKYYGIKEDGSVVIYNPYPQYSEYIPNEERSLAGAKELYPIGEIMFGLSDAGDLLVSGGNEWFLNEYCEGDEFVTDLSSFTGIKQLIAPRDWGINYVMALREDGTAVALDQKINQNLTYLPEIEKLVLGFDDEGGSYICGIQEDGNVVGVEVLASGSTILHKDNFRGWNVEDMYTTKMGTLIGFCADGRIVSTHESTDTAFVHYMTPISK